MESKDSSKTILSIWAANQVASQAFQLEHNKRFLVRTGEDMKSRRRVPQRRKRESTPQYQAPSRIEVRLQTDHGFEPRDLTKGWCFGSDPTHCDVLLDEDNSRGVSGLHFEINHNWSSFAVVITNRSGNPLTITLPRQEPDQIVTGQTRALLKEPCMVSLEVGLLQLIIVIPTREDQSAYEANLRAYCARAHEALPSLAHLNFQKRLNPTPAVALHRYFQEKRLGYGSYGTVFSALDAYSGDVVALKRFHDSVSYENIESEILILKDVTHENIVRYIEYVHSERLLVMEYIPGGTLLDLRQISHQQIYRMAMQMTSALLYLHGKGITHRDLKPANILVETVTPFHVKLADFSDSAKATNLNLATFCGTPTYRAPEIECPPYTNVVDVWSLGVVLIERWYDWYPDFIYSLSISGRDTFLQETLRGFDTWKDTAKAKARERLPWTNLVRNKWINHVRSKLEEEMSGSCQMAKLFLNMFEVNPQQRWSAEICYTYLKMPEQFDSFELRAQSDVVGHPGNLLEQSVLFAKSDRRPSKKLKLLDESPVGQSQAIPTIRISLRPCDKMVAATDLLEASSKRDWPKAAIFCRYKTSPTPGRVCKAKMKDWVTYSDGLDLASRLGLLDSSLTILRTRMEHASDGLSEEVEVPMVPTEEILATQNIIHIWPRESLINATNLVTTAGMDRRSIPQILKRNQIQTSSHKRMWGMQGIYVKYEDGLRLCKDLCLPTDKVNLAIKEGWLGPILERRVSGIGKWCASQDNSDSRAGGSKADSSEADGSEADGVNLENGDKLTGDGSDIERDSDSELEVEFHHGEDSEHSDVYENQNHEENRDLSSFYSSPRLGNTPLPVFLPNLHDAIQTDVEGYSSLFFEEISFSIPELR